MYSCNFWHSKLNSVFEKTLQFLLVERSWLGDLQGMSGGVDATLSIRDVGASHCVSGRMLTKLSIAPQQATAQKQQENQHQQEPRQRI